MTAPAIPEICDGWDCLSTSIMLMAAVDNNKLRHVRRPLEFEDLDAKSNVLGMRKRKSKGGLLDLFAFFAF